MHLDRRTVLTTQLYFDDEVSDQVFSEGEYQGGGDSRQRNDSDGNFEESLVLALERRERGYLGLKNFDVART